VVLAVLTLPAGSKLRVSSKRVVPPLVRVILRSVGRERRSKVALY